MLIPGLYRHYKGNIYRLICIARHSETLEELVIYQDARQPEKCGARPVGMWEENVMINGKSVPRFSYLGETDGGRQDE